MLTDGGGDDSYKAVMRTALGAGHDYGIGVVVENGGDDAYAALDVSLGAGNANGLGIFWDKAGDDAYDISSEIAQGATQIQPGGLKDMMLCLGLFMDTGGYDTYPAGKSAKNGAVWTNPCNGATGAYKTQVGVGLDED